MDLQQRSMITSEEIFEDLCRKIENLDYMPGEFISENELCSQYSTSRHMVRAAFLMLRQRKLLQVYPQRGSYISLIDLDYVAKIIFLRESIEQEAAQRLLDKDDAVDAACDRMEELIAKQRERVKDKEQSPDEAYYRLDAEFHDILLEAAGQKDIMHMLDDIYIHFRRWRNLELRSNMRLGQLVEQHEEIVRKLRSRDRIGVRKSLHTHIDAVELFQAMGETDKNQYFYKKE